MREPSPRDRGDRGELHRDVGEHRGGVVWPGYSETKAAADRAWWEGNTGADGASRCEEWEGGVETVLSSAFYRARTTKGRRSGSNLAAARWSLTPPVSKSNRGRGIDGVSS
jgi:hypothetical protein